LRNNSAEVFFLCFFWYFLTTFVESKYLKLVIGCLNISCVLMEVNERNVDVPYWWGWRVGRRWRWRVGRRRMV